MKKTLIAILLVVFLLTMIVPTVFAAAPPPKPPNLNKDCFGEEISYYAQHPPVEKNFGQLIKAIIQIAGDRISDVMHATRATCAFTPPVSK